MLCSQILEMRGLSFLSISSITNTVFVFSESSKKKLFFTQTNQCIRSPTRGTIRVTNLHFLLETTKTIKKQCHWGAINISV